MNTATIDSVSIQLKKYIDKDRTVVVAGGREFGPPQCKIEVMKLVHGEFHELSGVAVSAHVTARDSKTNELVVSFYTQV